MVVTQIIFQASFSLKQDLQNGLILFVIPTMFFADI